MRFTILVVAGDETYPPPNQAKLPTETKAMPLIVLRVDPEICAFNMKTLKVPVSNAAVAIETLAEPIIPSELFTIADPVLLTVVPVATQYILSPVLNPIVVNVSVRVDPAPNELAPAELVIC